MATPSTIFSKRAKQNHRRPTPLERLEQWLDSCTRELKEFFADGLFDANGEIKGGRLFSIDVDASSFSKKELEPVAQKIEALHDLCRSLDVRFEVAGFDLLPRSHTILLGTAEAGAKTCIGVHPWQTYGHYSHPRCEKPYKGDNGFFQDREEALTPEEARQEMAGGLAEKIEVKSPLRLKPPGSG